MRYDPERECSKMVQRLRKICAAKGISVYAAARKANISVSTLTELLNEKTRPQVYTLYKSATRWIFALSICLTTMPA